MLCSRHSAHLQGKEILFVNRSLSIHTSLSHTKVVKKMYKSYSKVIKNLQKHASKYQKTQKNSQNLAILTVLLEAPPGSPPSAELRRGFRPGFCARARRVRSDEGGVPPTQKRTLLGAFALEAPPGIGPGMKVLQTSALPLGYGAVQLGTGTFPHSVFYSKAAPYVTAFEKKRARCFRARDWSGLRGSNPPPPPWQGGALPNELNPRKWCLRSESNQRHGDFQSPALPTELQRHTARAVFL